MIRFSGHMAADCPRAQWFLGRAPGRVALDIGFVGENCHLLHDLLRKQFPETFFIGYDIDARGVREAGVPCAAVGDATRMPFADGSFDAIVAGEIIEHISPCDPVLTEAHRILRPGGRLYISTPNGFDPLKLLRWWFLPARPRARHNYRGYLGHPTHRNVVTPPSLLGRLDDIGFEIVDCRTRRVKVPLVSKFTPKPLIITLEVWPLTRFGEFLCLEARKR